MFGSLLHELLTYSLSALYGLAFLIPQDEQQKQIDLEAVKQ